MTFAADAFRQLMRLACDAEPIADAELLGAVQQAAGNWPGDAETAAACVDRSLEALSHIDRNAHQTTLLECWLDDLARIVATGRAVPSYNET